MVCGMSKPVESSGPTTGGSQLPLKWWACVERTNDGAGMPGLHCFLLLMFGHERTIVRPP
jgi:hypothetical protein